MSNEKDEKGTNDSGTNDILVEALREELTKAQEEIVRMRQTVLRGAINVIGVLSYFEGLVGFFASCAERSEDEATRQELVKALMIVNEVRHANILILGLHLAALGWKPHLAQTAFKCKIENKTNEETDLAARETLWRLFEAETEECLSKEARITARFLLIDNPSDLLVGSIAMMGSKVKH